MEPNPTPSKLKRFLGPSFWAMIIIGLTVKNFLLWSEANELRAENQRLAVEIAANKKILDDAIVQKIIKAIEESK